MNGEQVLQILHHRGCFTRGDYRLKSSLTSKYYINVRLLVSFPDSLAHIARALWSRATMDLDTPPDFVVGVPYGAVPLATAISVLFGIPMLTVRKESKEHGMSRLIEGVFTKGQTCVLVEDVVSTGSSILNCKSILQASGIQVVKEIAVVKRGDHPIPTLLQFDESNGDSFTWRCDISLSPISFPPEELKKGVHVPENIASKQLRAVMKCKGRVCVAADFTKSQEILDFADKVGKFVCIFKIHSDIITDNSDNFRKLLRAKALSYNFLIMEDRKIADIGFIAQKQLEEAAWAHLVTVHAIPGQFMLDALQTVCTSRYTNLIGVVVVTEMSCAGSLSDTQYIEKATQMIQKTSTPVAGIVAQSRYCSLPLFMPGIGKGDALGQRASSLLDAASREADIVIVGRSISNADNPETACKEIAQAWK